MPSAARSAGDAQEKDDARHVEALVGKVVSRVVSLNGAVAVTKGRERELRDKNRSAWCGSREGRDKRGRPR